MTQHTAGPWHRNIRAEGKYAVIFSGRNTHVAVASGHGNLPGAEIEANIDLIAAAPELLAALELIVEHFGDPLKVANSAIAKARGTK